MHSSDYDLLDRGEGRWNLDQGTLAQVGRCDVCVRGESSALSDMYTTNEESVSVTQLLGEFSPESKNGREFLGLLGDQSDFWLGQANMASRVDDDSFVYTSDPSFSNVCFSSQKTSAYSGSGGNGDIYNSLHSSSQGFYYQQGRDTNQIFATNDILHYFNSVDFGFEEDENASSGAYVYTAMQLDEGSNQLENNNAKDEVLVGESPFNSAVFHGTKLEIQVLDDTIEGRGTSPPAELEKRPRKAEAPKNKRNVKPRKSKKTAEITSVDDESSYQLLTQTSSSNCLKDDASAHSDINDVETSNLTSTGSLPRSANGKTRANRGSATDPQSLYARKRREKINDRLRILQGLVPNGTKVDISTMLDEAVQYVKFLQLQIKLLSSDDMWMYAPLAYNGMDLGLSIEM